MPGPIGKRDEERRRRNKDAVPTTTVDLDTLLAGEVEIPLADDEWHDVAKLIWDSLPKSGQSIFMEASDWAAAYLLCESISRDLNEQVVGITESGEVVKSEIPLKGASLSAYLKGFASLMMTEGDRRRLKIELERKKARDAAASGDGVVVSITQNRAELFKNAGTQR